MKNINSFQSLKKLAVHGTAYSFFSLRQTQKQDSLAKLPFSLKILLENLLRHEDGKAVRKQDI